MLKKVLDFILLSMGITPKGGDPEQDKWVEIRRRAEADRQAGGDAPTMWQDAGGGDGDD